MAKQVHVFKSEVHHDKVKYVKGSACPEALEKLMLSKGLIRPLIEEKAVDNKPTAPAPGGAKAPLQQTEPPAKDAVV